MALVKRGTISRIDQIERAGLGFLLGSLQDASASGNTSKFEKVVMPSVIFRIV
jgi:hypothetical protein